jgi:hypothetical protein
VQDWLADQSFQKTQDWPANSPDLNPIENVWAMLTRAVAKHVIDDTAELQRIIILEWDNLSLDTIRKLYNSIHMRYALVIKDNGEPTKY